MNRRNKNKTAANATVKPSQPQKPTAPPTQTTAPPEQPPPPPPSAGPGPSQFAKPASQKLPSPALITSAKLRKEWNNFEVWLSARRADRDRRVSERLKELMAATGKSKLQKQLPDMSAFETNLNEELAEQARTEWLRRLGVAGLKEEDWVDMTENEMKAIEAAFVPQMNTSAPLGGTKAASPDHLSTSPGGVEWAVPGGWDTPSSSAPLKASNKSQADTAAPARNSPLSNGWGFFGEKPNAPTPESLWDMHMAKNSLKPPTPPSSNIPSSTLPTPETLWDMHVAKKAPPPLTPPPTEPVSPDTLWEPSVVKRLPVREISTPAPPKKVSANKPAKQPPPSQGLWGATSAELPPEPPRAVPNHTGNSIESAHNHGYMSPLLIELECDEFPIAPSDILSNELIEESIREWHQQAAEADIQLRKQLLSTHWAKRDWDELLGSHVQEMERNARTVVGHWKSMSDAEKERRLKEDKQRRLAGIRNVTGGNRRWGSPTSAERTPSPAPPVATQTKKTPVPEAKKPQPARKGAAKKFAATVEDATSSEWEERSATPSISTDKSKAGRKDSVDTESLWSKDPPASKGPSGLLSSLWGKAAATPPEAPTPAAQERKRPVNGPSKGAIPSVAEPVRTTAASPSWDEPQSQKIDKNFWNASGASVEDEDDEPTDNSMWNQATIGDVRGGAASAWNFAMNAISGDKAGAAKPPMKSSSPPVAGPGSFWSNEPAYAKVMSEGPGAGSYGSAGTDGRFTPWKPSILERPNADETTTKMANLAMEHLYQTADADDAYDPNELHNAMSMYTKAVASSTRKKR